MAEIDETLTFHPLQIAILTISDTRDETSDRSGAFLAERLTAAGHRLQGKAIVRDEILAIREQLTRWIDDPEIDVVLTTGGTGLSPRDVTPEAVRPLFSREIDGFAVVFHQVSFGTVGVHGLWQLADSAVTPASLYATLGWRHALGDLVPLAQQQFADGERFTVRGVPLTANAALVQLGIDAALSKHASLRAGYDGVLAGSESDHAVRLTLQVAF